MALDPRFDCEEKKRLKCIQTNFTYIHRWVSGFGLAKNYMVSDELMYVDIFTVEQKICRASFEDIRKGDINLPNVTDNMFCAGDIGGGKDSCLGDSGSAFVMKDDDVHYVKGIVSWGITPCGKKGTYGVYTQVSRYLDWIKKIMSENY